MGIGGRETGRKGAERCTGGGRRGGGKRDTQGGGKQEKKGKIMQHRAKFCNRKNAKRWEQKITGREPGLKGTGSGRFKPPCSSPPRSSEPAILNSRTARNAGLWVKPPTDIMRGHQGSIKKFRHNRLWRNLFVTNKQKTLKIFTKTSKNPSKSLKIL